MKNGLFYSGSWDHLQFDEKLYNSRMNAKYGSTSVDMSECLPKPKHMMLNGDYTTIVWTDGTSTVVKRMKGEKDDPEKAILFAIMKKVFDGNKANLDRYLSEFEDKTIIKEKKDKKKRGK